MPLYKRKNAFRLRLGVINVSIPRQSFAVINFPIGNGHKYMLTEYRSGAFGTGNLVIIDAVYFFRAVGRINYAIFFVNSVTVIAGVFTYVVMEYNETLSVRLHYCDWDDYAYGITTFVTPHSVGDYIVSTATGLTTYSPAFAGAPSNLTPSL